MGVQAGGKCKASETGGGGTGRGEARRGRGRQSEIIGGLSRVSPCHRAWSESVRKEKKEKTIALHQTRARALGSLSAGRDMAGHISSSRSHGRRGGGAAGYGQAEVFVSRSMLQQLLTCT